MFFLVLVLICCVTPTTLVAAVPQTMSYSAVLRDTVGAPLTGTYDFKVRYYDASTGGILLYEEEFGTVTINSGGTFFLSLGAGTVVSGAFTSINFNTPVFISLNTKVTSAGVYDGEMLPRIPLRSVPYALNSEKLGGRVVGGANGIVAYDESSTIQTNGLNASGSVNILNNLNVSATSTLTSIVSNFISSLVGIFDKLFLNNVATSTFGNTILTRDTVTGEIKQNTLSNLLASSTSNTLNFSTATGILSSSVNGIIATSSLSNIISPITVQNTNSLFATGILNPAGVGSNGVGSNFFGENAGLNATNANTANFFGVDAGNGATNAAGSNFFGQQAGLKAFNTNSANFFGVSAGSNASNASYSNFFGVQSGSDATNANDSNFFGRQAGFNASSASNSNFFGRDAGQNAIGADISNFIGLASGQDATNARLSNFIGRAAGFGATNAEQSNFIGNGAGVSAIDAANSTFIGTNAGRFALNANDSIFIGRNSGNGDTVNNLTILGTSILIGNNTNTGGFSNSIALGEGAVNTKVNQFSVGPSYTDFNFRGVNYTFPSTQGGAGTTLTNNGSGVLSWVAGAPGTTTAGWLLTGNAGTVAGTNFIGTTDNQDVVFKRGGIEFGRLGGNISNSGIFFGNGAGSLGGSQAATNFFGVDAGRGATGANYSNFFGQLAGAYATNANNSNFFGQRAGLNSVNAEYSYFAGVRAGENAPNASNAIFIGRQAGLDDTVDNVSNFGSSIAIGFGAGTGGFSNSIALGTGGVNTATNQFLVGFSYTDFNFRGVNYRFPSTQGATGTVLTNDGSGGLNWSVAGGLSSTPITVENGNSLFATGLLNPSGIDATNAFNSIFLGENAGLDATNAANSNFFGPSAGNGATSANSSNFLGLSAGQDATNASGSNFFGDSAGLAATAASNSNFFGSSAGLNATNANNSNFLGVLAGQEAINAANSNFFGQAAGQSAVAASFSNFFGFQSGLTATNAFYSNFLGSFAGTNATFANNSNFLGADAGSGATNASNSTFIGENAGQNAVNSNNSIFIGKNSGLSDVVNNSTLGFSSILIGDNTNTGGFSNSIALGEGAINTATNQFYLRDAITNFNLAGVNYNFPTLQATTSGQVLSNDGLGNLSWALPVSVSTSTGPITAQNGSTLYSSGISFIPTTGAANSVFLGYAAGHNADNSNYSNFIGAYAGYGNQFNSGIATQASNANFFGNSAGYGAAQASNSIFIGNNAGFDDTVNNSSPGFSSILIGDNTNTGGFSNSIAIGKNAVNTNVDQFLVGQDYTNFSFRGVNYVFPSAQATTSGQVLTNDGTGILSWTAGGLGSSPITVQNVNSLFATGLTNPAGVASFASDSIFLGNSAGGNATFANNANFFGQRAGLNAINANDSNFFGQDAGRGSTNASFSNFIGYGAGRFSTAASYSNILGYEAGVGAANASDSNFIGHSAGLNAINANNANFFGFNAGNGATNAPTSNFIGLNSGLNAVSAAFSNFFGANAGNDATNASASNFFGISAGENAINANNSIFIGKQAGFGDTVNNSGVGLSSILIGNDTNTGGFSNSIALGEGAINTNTNQLYIRDAITNFNLAGVNYTFPSAQATTSGQVLTNDGTGILSWAAAGVSASPITVQNTSSIFSTGLPSPAGVGVTLAQNAIFLGQSAGTGATGAFNSNFLGQFSGQNAANALRSNFFGSDAGRNATNAGNSNFLGYFAGHNATNANSSNFFGEFAGQAAVSANRSNFFGVNAGTNATNANNSIFIGVSAGLNDTVNNSTTGFSSIAIGDESGTGGFSNSIAIGKNAINTAANQFILGRGTNAANSISQISLGRNNVSAFPLIFANLTGVGIGTITPTQRLQVGEAGNTGNLLVFGTASTCSIGTGVGATLCSSDERLKYDIATSTSNLEKILSLRSVDYKWNSNLNRGTSTQLGLIAQEVEKIFPGYVSEVYDGYKGVDYAALVTPLIGAIQDQQKLLGGFTYTPSIGIATSTLILAIQEEVIFDPVAIIDTKIKAGKQVLTDFVAARVTAIRGYFDQIFTREITTEKLCLKDAAGITCYNRQQIEHIQQATNTNNASTNVETSNTNTAPNNNTQTEIEAETNTGSNTNEPGDAGSENSVNSINGDIVDTIE